MDWTWFYGLMSFFALTAAFCTFLGTLDTWGKHYLRKERWMSVAACFALCLTCAALAGLASGWDGSY